MTDAGCPTAAPARFPYTDHRTLAEVDAAVARRDEATTARRVEPRAAAPQCQRRCRQCGHWRVAACSFSLCPLREASSGRQAVGQTRPPA